MTTDTKTKPAKAKGRQARRGRPVNPHIHKRRMLLCKNGRIEISPEDAIALMAKRTLRTTVEKNNADPDKATREILGECELDKEGRYVFVASEFLLDYEAALEAGDIATANNRLRMALGSWFNRGANGPKTHKVSTVKLKSGGTRCFRVELLPNGIDVYNDRLRPDGFTYYEVSDKAIEYAHSMIDTDTAEEVTEDDTEVDNTPSDVFDMPEMVVGDLEDIEIPEDVTV